MDLEFDIAKQDGVAILAARGELDVYAARQLREQLMELVEQGQRHIIVDLDAVEFLDSSGLGVLVGALKRLRDQDGDLALVYTRPRLLTLLQITGLDRILRVHDTAHEAVSAFHHPSSTRRPGLA